MSPDRAYLDDILRSARLAMSYVAGMSVQQFDADAKTQDAVIRRLEVIGEAVKWLDDGAKAAMPEIDWRRIADMRNLMIHKYWDVDLDIVWDTVQRDVPRVIAAIEAYLK